MNTQPLRLSLRWRLTLYYGAVLLLFTLLAGAAFYSSLRRDLNQTMNAHLQTVARQVAQLWSGGNTLSGLPERDIYNVAVSVLDAQGKVLASKGTVPISSSASGVAPGQAELAGQRIYTLDTGSGVLIRVSTSEFELFEALGHTQKLLFLTLPLLVLIGLGSGYLLIERALRPIDEVSRVARQIAASGQYTERVPEPLGHDEAADTARTVNAMLERLAALIEHERAFSLAAAHELRTPLSVLLARTQLGLESETLEEARSALSRNERSVRELVTLVDGLLSLARSQGSPVQLTTDLSDVALRALESFEQGLQVTVNLDLQRSPVLGDPLALQLAVRNLLENAVKYGRGQLWLSTGVTLEHSWLSVMDDGPGIPPPDRARLLRPFQQLDLQSSGSGLGLALVQTVAQRHGAEVLLEHPPDGRFTVRLTFPASHTPPLESP